MSVRGLVDYHLHTSTSTDAHATVEEYCVRASELGLKEIAITNHMNLRTADYHLTPTTMVEVWEDIERCRSKCPDLTVRLGMEVDYFDDLEDTIADALPAYSDALGRDLDFVMGSVHVVRGVRFASTKHARELYVGADPLPIYREYFELMIRAVSTGMFDVMAHPDLIKRFTGLHSPPVPFDAYRQVAASLIEALVEFDVGIEINVKGLEHPVGEVYPSADLLVGYIAAVRAAGREPVLVLGTDAHRPEKLGMNLRVGADLLKRAGVSVLTTFNQGMRIPFPLCTFPNLREDE